jgi:hypothetical protein
VIPRARCISARNTNQMRPAESQVIVIIEQFMPICRATYSLLRQSQKLVSDRPSVAVVLAFPLSQPLANECRRGT